MSLNPNFVSSGRIPLSSSSSSSRASGGYDPQIMMIMIGFTITIISTTSTTTSYAQLLSTDAHATTTTTTGGSVASGAATTTTTTTATTATTDKGAITSEEQKRFEAWMAHPLHVAPFDPKLTSMPDLQLAFVRNMTQSDLAMFRDIVNEAIEGRKKWAPSVKLMLKYGGKLLSTFIRNRQLERKLPVKVEPHPDFFTMIADLVQAIIDRSTAIKRERGYTKSNFDVEEFRVRTNVLFDYFKRIIDTCPLGAYLRWNELVLYKDEPKNPKYKGDFVEEASDLLAQFRGMGYESTTFLARRIVNMLRLFGRGIVPSSENEV